MLDTVILHIPHNHYQIVNYELFQYRSVYYGRRSQTYLPKVTRVSKFGTEYLKIEFSVPKLVFGNNLDELEESDFEAAVTTLYERLNLLGIDVSIDYLSTAQVMALHASKNIPLSGGYTASSILRDLQKINLTKRLDLQDTKYRNEGQIIQFYSKSHAFVMYDKVADVLKTNGRSFDKATPQYKEKVEERLEQGSFEVLRLEARLQSKEKLSQMLTKLGYPKNLVFKDIFNKELAKAIVLDYWKKTTNENLVLFEMANNPEVILNSILTAYPRIKPQKAFSLAFVILYGKDHGLRQLRQILGEHITQDTWYRISKEFREVSSKITKPNPLGYMKIINRELERFSSYKLDTS